MYNKSSFLAVANGCFYRLFGCKPKSFFFAFIKLVGLVGLALGLSSCSSHWTGVLNPKGLIAHQERKLLVDSIALMLIVVIPVIIMSFAFASRYSAKKKNNAKYHPNWSHSYLLESIWWGVPCVLIVILGVMTWTSTHKLDPYRPLAIPGKPLIVETVALRWKWLFIYPEQNIATVNYLELPKDRQVEFLITADAPMSSFFIPQLGSQIYAMAGMRTRLHLVANANGVYEGMNTQYNGDGFSYMQFKVRVTDTADFNQWVQTMKLKHHSLTIPEYQQLVKPTEINPPLYFSAAVPGLFKRIMMQYRKPNMRLH